MTEEFALSFSDVPDLAVDEEGEYTEQAVASILEDLSDLRLSPDAIRVSQAGIGDTGGALAKLMAKAPPSPAIRG